MEAERKAAAHEKLKALEDRMKKPGKEEPPKISPADMGGILPEFHKAPVHQRDQLVSPCGVYVRLFNVHFGLFFLVLPPVLIFGMGLIFVCFTGTKPFIPKLGKSRNQLFLKIYMWYSTDILCLYRYFKNFK